jgi:hypothetical protein
MRSTAFFALAAVLLLAVGAHAIGITDERRIHRGVNDVLAEDELQQTQSAVVEQEGFFDTIKQGVKDVASVAAQSAKVCGFSISWR